MSASLERLHQAGVLAALDFRLSECLGRLGLERDPLALLGVAAASWACRQGHVCLELDRLAGQPIAGDQAADGALGRWPPLAAWVEALVRSPLVAADADAWPDRPLVIEGGRRLYLARYWNYQRRLAQALLQRAAQPADDLDPIHLAAGLDRLFPESARKGQSDLQREAVRVALERRLAIISGGPGTGKTTIVARILSLAAELAQAAGRAAPRIALLAPTGKAAARLGESVGTGLPAATIHRALGPDPFRATRFRHDAKRPLAADLVVVDEASMVDLALMSKLVDAVPTDARLVLLGDRDQLASVEAGAILGDLCPPADAPLAPGPLAACLVQLTHSFRFGPDSPVGRLARAINAGRPDPVIDLLHQAQGDGLTWIEPSDPARLPARLDPIIRQGYRASLRADNPLERLARFNDFRILCAVRSGPTGVETLNRLAERLLAADGLRPEGTWYPGRPVMITRNDYGLGLYNGDVGLVFADDVSSGLRVLVAGHPRPLSPARLPACETVFAMTAHKSQGSEFDSVLVVLPERESPVVTRELLYTAVTRARERVILCASEQVLRQAVATPVQRASGLRALLWGG